MIADGSEAKEAPLKHPEIRPVASRSSLQSEGPMDQEISWFTA